MKRLPIRHIGYLALCSAEHHDNCIARIDLGAARYRQLGVRERFTGEKPYRVCKRCLAVVVQHEKHFGGFRRKRSRDINCQVDKGKS